jgi:hypothetical protein
MLPFFLAGYSRFVVETWSIQPSSDSIGNVSSSESGFHLAPDVTTPIPTMLLQLRTPLGTPMLSKSAQ